MNVPPYLIVPLASVRHTISMYEVAIAAFSCDFITSRNITHSCSASMKLVQSATSRYVNVIPSGLDGSRTSGYSTQAATADEMKENGIETVLYAISIVAPV